MISGKRGEKAVATTGANPSLANCCYTVASIDTQCIDSNLESGRYISRVGRASKFLSLVSLSTTVP